MEWRLNWLVAFSLIFFSFFSHAGDLNSQSQIKFEKQKIKINNQTLLVEVAEANEQHERGLMYRNKLPANEGMLFIFKDPRVLNFWMKNTFIDLSIAYIDQNKIIVDIQEMKATNQLMLGEPRSYPSQKAAMYALEMNSGWFKKHKIRIGHKFEFLRK